MTGDMMVYYAHHQWKYHTEVENYELALIKRYFKYVYVFNPSTDLDEKGKTEADIMKTCLSNVEKSDILVFSSIDGCIGVGVFQEVERAKKLGKLVLYIYHDRLTTEFDIHATPNFTSDRVYAFVDVKGDR